MFQIRTGFALPRLFLIDCSCGMDYYALELAMKVCFKHSDESMVFISLIDPNQHWLYMH